MNDSRLSIILHQELPENLYDLAYFLVDLQCIAACADRLTEGRAMPAYPSAFTSRRATARYRESIALKDVRRGTLLYDVGVGFLAALLFYYFQKHVLEPRQRADSGDKLNPPSRSRMEFSDRDKHILHNNLPADLSGNIDIDLPRIIGHARQRGHIPRVTDPVRRRLHRYRDTPEDNQALRNAMERVLADMRRTRDRHR